MSKKFVAHVKPSLIDLKARWGNKGQVVKNLIEELRHDLKYWEKHILTQRPERLSEKARKGCDSPNLTNK